MKMKQLAFRYALPWKWNDQILNDLLPTCYITMNLTIDLMTS